MTKELQKYNQLKQDMQEQQSVQCQLKEQHYIEMCKQKTTLDDACKHYQSTLIEEQDKLQLKIQELEVSRFEVGQMQSETTKNQEDLKAKEAMITQLQGQISSLEQKLDVAHLEIQALEKSHAEASHLLLIAQNTSSKNRLLDHDIQNPQLNASLKASAGLHSIKTPVFSTQAVLSKKSVQHAKPFNPSASPPATKNRESPKTKKRDRTKVLQGQQMYAFPHFHLQVEEIPVRQPELGKNLSHSSQLLKQDEERHQRIFTWMEQSSGVIQKAKDTMLSMR